MSVINHVPIDQSQDIDVSTIQIDLPTWNIAGYSFKGHQQQRTLVILHNFNPKN
jgi:hypothetical protein